MVHLKAKCVNLSLHIQSGDEKDICANELIEGNKINKIQFLFTEVIFMILFRLHVIVFRRLYRFYVNTQQHRYISISNIYFIYNYLPI